MPMSKDIVTQASPRAGRSDKTFAVGRKAGVIPALPARPHGKASRTARRVLPATEELEPKMRYRAHLPIMVLAFRDNHQAAVTIRAREIFAVVGPAEDSRFVVVDVRGEQFLVFGCDLRDRSKLVRARKAHA